MVERTMARTLRAGRKLLIAAAGGAVLLAGIVMIVLPGPAFAAIPAGLGILALEFEWAERCLDIVKARYHAALARLRRRGGSHTA